MNFDRKIGFPVLFERERRIAMTALDEGRCSESLLAVASVSPLSEFQLFLYHVVA